MAFDAARRFDGDRRALCLTGLGFGGNGVYDLAAARPDAWAALWSVNPMQAPPVKLEAPLRIDRGDAYAEAAGFDWLLEVARLRSERSAPG